MMSHAGVEEVLVSGIVEAFAGSVPLNGVIEVVPLCGTLTSAGIQT